MAGKTGHLFLNGSRIALKGTNRHSFWPTSGRALNYNLCLEDVLTLKEMNMNAVRMSPYPPDSYFLDLRRIRPLRFGGAGRLVKQMVMWDANHPSIVFWDNGNDGG